MTFDFMVGDKVVVVASSYGWGRIELGDEGTVVDIDKGFHSSMNKGVITAKFERQSNWRGRACDFELISRVKLLTLLDSDA